MNHTPPPLSALPVAAAVPLEQRLDALERQVRRQRRIVALCVLALLFLIVLIAAAEALSRQTQIASFRRVQLVDQLGRLRAVLTAEGDAPRLAFLDHGGAKWAALELGTEKAGPYISLLENHQHRLAITRRQIVVRDAQSSSRIWLGLAEEKKGGASIPVLCLNDSESRERLRVATKSNGPSIALRDAAGNLQFDLFASESSHGITLYDDQRRQRSDWRVVDNQPAFTILDPQSRVRLIAGWSDPRELAADGEGVVALRLLDQRGHNRASLASLGGDDYDLTLYDSRGRPRRATTAPVAQ